MTTQEHIYAIKNILSKGSTSDDFNFSNRLILHFMNVARALLMERKADKYNYMQSFQSLCVDLAEGQYHNCCDIKIPKDCTILKSKYTLPKLLSVRWGNFVKVTTMDGTVISESSITQSSYSKYGINKNIQGYFIHDNYLYLVNNHKLRKVLVNGLWDSPEDIATFNCPDKQNCNPLEDLYPIDSDLVAEMYKLVIEYLSIKSPQDNENDSRAPEDYRAIGPNEN